MRNGNNLHNKAFELAEKYCAGDATHQRDHLERVWKLAQWLAKKQKPSVTLDLENLEMAVILHDLGQGKQIQKLRHGRNKFSSGNHTREGLKLVQVFLQEEGLAKNEIEKIQKIIASHGTNGENHNLEGDILHDADLLDNIGLVGILRKFIYGSQIGRSLAGSLDYARLKINERKFRTKAGRALGQKRVNLVKRRLKEIETDLYGEDF